MLELDQWPTKRFSLLGVTDRLQHRTFGYAGASDAIMSRSLSQLFHQRRSPAPPCLEYVRCRHAHSEKNNSQVLTMLADLSGRPRSNPARFSSVSATISEIPATPAERFVRGDDEQSSQ